MNQCGVDITQAGTWDPLLKALAARQMLPHFKYISKIQRNKGPKKKKAVHMQGKLWTIRYKKTKNPKNKQKKTQLPLSKSQEQNHGVEGKTQGIEYTLHTQHQQRVGKTRKGTPPTQPWICPPLTTNRASPPPPSRSCREPLPCFLSQLCSRSCKALPSFFFTLPFHFH